MGVISGVMRLLYLRRGTEASLSAARRTISEMMHYWKSIGDFDSGAVALDSRGSNGRAVSDESAFM